MSKEKTSIKKIFTDGLFDKNPILVQLLGTCATLAVTTSVSNGLAMGLSTTAVLVCSNLFISLLRNFIPKEVRIASYIVVISGFVTAIELLIKAFLPEINKSLGVFIPLIVVNCIILSRAESFASKNKPFLAMLDGVAMGAGFTMALVVVSAIREFLGSGTFLGVRVTPVSFEPALIFIMSAGAFFTLAFVIAGMNKIMDSVKKKAEKKEVK
ncbi:MAG: electron transport complex subunit E [Ruminococcaceae bacterium]|nr:electron transport complex subunit E [Oscillospiraceae bacterium]